MIQTCKDEHHVLVGRSFGSNSCHLEKKLQGKSQFSCLVEGKIMHVFNELKINEFAIFERHHEYWYATWVQPIPML